MKKKYVVLVFDGENYGVVMNVDFSPIFTEEQAKYECSPDFVNEDFKYRMICIEDQFLE